MRFSRLLCLAIPAVIAFGGCGEPQTKDSDPTKQDATKQDATKQDATKQDATKKSATEPERVLTYFTIPG